MKQRLLWQIARAHLYATTSLFIGVGTAMAQTVAQRAGANVLLNFSVRNSTPQGQAILRANLDTSITINRASNAAQRAQAIKDASQTPDLCSQFVYALGPSLSD